MWSSSLTQTTLGRELIRGTVAADVPRILKALIRFDLRAGEAMTANLRSGPEIVEAFSTWRDRIGDRHPWFVTLNLFDAHAPYRTPYEYRFNDGERRIDRYDGAIAWVDEMVGRIVEILRTRGELDRTLVIVTSDHGEFFGEHGLVDHGRPPYLPVVHVPLVMRYPPRLTPARHATPVTNADVPATILDVVGAPGGMLPGRSLAGSAATDTTSLVLFLANRLINADTSRRASRGRFLGALTEQWHLIRGPDGSEELYRWRVDSLETENLAGLPEVAADQAALGALLRAPSSRRTVR
jgi:arylsulfatase A-like enzyme